MIDEEKQAAFAGELSHFAVTLCMRQQKLEISVMDTTTLRKFHQTIDQPFIESQDKFFSSYFESPADVFAYLSHHFSEIEIEKGVLRFSYASGVKQQVREVVIEMEKEQEDESTLLQLRIAKVKEHFAVQLEQRDQRITALQQGLSEMANELRQHKQKIRDRQKENQQELERMKERLQREERNCKDLQERLQKAEVTVAAMTSQHPKKETETSQEHQTISPQAICHHPDNNHYPCYKIVNSTASSVKLYRARQSNNYNFVNKYEVLPKQHNRYAVTIVRVRSSWLCIGFCTKQGFGILDNFNNTESVYYYCSNKGYLWHGGVQKGLSDCGSANGDVVECTADIQEGKIRWQKSGKLLTQCSLPTAMKGKPIFFSIILYSEDDQLEVSSL